MFWITKKVKEKLSREKNHKKTATFKNPSDKLIGNSFQASCNFGIFWMNTAEFANKHTNKNNGEKYSKYGLNPLPTETSNVQIWQKKPL